MACCTASVAGASLSRRSNVPDRRSATTAAGGRRVRAADACRCCGLSTWIPRHLGDGTLGVSAGGWAAAARVELLCGLFKDTVSIGRGWVHGPGSAPLQILLTVDAQEGAGTSRLLEDRSIAEQVGQPLLQRQQQIELLESHELVVVTKTFGPRYDVALTPKGREALEQSNHTSEPAARRIGF